MKKFLLILLTLSMLIALALPAAAAGVSLTAAASKTTAYLNDEVIITVSVSGSDSYTSLGFFIEYDKNVFEYKSRNWGAGIIDANTKSHDTDSGKVTAVWEDAGAYTGEMIKITLKVKKALPGKTTISFGQVSCNNVNNAVTINTSSVQISLACEHSYGAWTKLDGNKHQRICSKCGYEDKADHNWGNGVGSPAPDCHNPGTMKYECPTCKATKSEDVGALKHKYDNDCDAECNLCGDKRDVSHDYQITSNDGGHWYKCSKCAGIKEWSAHTPGPEATEDTAQVCTVCNFEIKAALGHVHEMENEWTTDAEYHWHRCGRKDPSCYYVEDKAKHDYDNDCDVDCNTCNYIRIAPHSYNSEWKANKEGHWQNCDTCGAKSEVFPHVPGPEATETEPQRCTECNFVIKMELSHVHDIGDTWYGDDEMHWQSCLECNEDTNAAPHDWDEGVEVADGIQYTCGTCGKELIRTEPIATEPTTPPATQKPANTEEGGGFPWQWAGIAAIVLLLIGVVLLVIEFLRSRKTNMHGKYSK